MLKKALKIILWIGATLLLLITLTIGALFLEIRPGVPELAVDTIANIQVPEVSHTANGIATSGKNNIRKNRYGLYELYVEGNAFERGLAAGALSAEQVKYQEEVFVQKITEIIPSKRYRSFLLTLIIWFNSKLHKHIHPEFIEEIYGISQSASPEFDFYGPAFYRILNYHAAHDIGHTLQAYNLVGCSSFAVWGDNSADSTLLIGRNFDFYFGEDFSKEKIIEFVAPEFGHKFAFVTWGGMTGAVSGMNNQGLTVTINAGTPSIAKRSGTPVSLLAREILQFASTIAEADSIARIRRTFVSESYLIGSANDYKAVIIEKTPFKQELVEVDNGKLLCTNHYQGTELNKTEENAKTMKRATGYRFNRLNQLVNNKIPLNQTDVAHILRDQRGIDNEDLGFANEMALNQLIAHHSVIFSPQKRVMWVSTPPYNLGAYIAYDLNTVFDSLQGKQENTPIDVATLEIEADTFLYSDTYAAYEEYAELKEKYIFFNFTGKAVSDTILDRLIELNPENFEPYLWKAYKKDEEENSDEALKYYQKSLQKAMPRASRERIEERIFKLEAQ